MTVEKIVNGEKVTLIPEGWLDTQTAAEFGAVTDQLGDDVKELTVDMGKLEFISSAGLRLIVSLHKKMNGNLMLLNVSKDICDVFAMTGFDKHLNIVR